MKLFDEIPCLENERLILKKIEDCDAGVLEEMADNENVKRYLPAFLLDVKHEDKHEAIRQMYGEAFTNRESLFLGIFLKDDPQNMAGVAEIYNYDPNWNKASIGYRIAEQYWHRGIAGNTIEMLKKYLFEQTDVKRITAHVIAENIYSCRAIERAGFRMRKREVPEDWGFAEPVIVNKYVLEKLGNIKYRKIGNGPKVMVMLPGLALKSTLGSADLIEENYRMFSDYTIYLFDDRENIGEHYSIRERAGDIAAEMKTLHIKHACVFGASMGGMVGQFLAIDHPDLVDRMVLSATCPRMNDTSREVIGKWKALAQDRDIKELVRSSIKDIYSPEVVKQFGDSFVAGIGVVSEDETDKYIKLSDAILGFDSYNELGSIKCRVLVVGSEGDHVLTAIGSREIADRVNGCECYIYGTEYGHGVYDEAPDHRQRILDFFEKD